jgi:predicted secreted acid phosphatase
MRKPEKQLSAMRLVVGLTAGIVACAGSRQPGVAPAPYASAPVVSVAAGVPNLYEAQRQVDQYIESGRYEKDVAKVVAAARNWLDERSKTAQKPAIVLDIDETSLSNWPAYRINGWGRVVGGGCDLENGPCGLRAWQALGRSKALAPTLALERRARELGVAVFFISGRPPKLREATERNLREQGYQWTGVILLPENAKFVSAVDFKAPERRRITQEGYTIVLALGDQESDLSGGYAERTFKLPNPVYFLP